MNIIKYFFLVLGVIGLSSCGKQERPGIDLTGIDVKTEVVRFDQRFYESLPEDLPKLKSEFPYLFPEPNPDSVWTAKIKDEDEQFLFKSAQEVFGDFKSEEKGLTTLFRHVKYYFPNFREPKVITILTNVDYNNKVVYADSLLFISLDTYLGKDHTVYESYPYYIRQNFSKSHLLVDVAGAISSTILMPPATNSFVSRMVQEGKKLKLTEAFLPEVPRAELMGYDQDQYKWATDNESDIWKYFIQKEMLFSNDTDLNERFLNDAPFSKFYLEVDKDSPGRIGAWFGWQIVNSFLEHNEVGLIDMLKTDNEEIFNKSKYKPKKK